MSPHKIRPTHSIVPALQHVVDGTAIALTLVLAQWVLTQPFHVQTLQVGLLAALTFFILGELAGLYRVTPSRSPDIEVASIAMVWIGTFGLLSVAGIMTRIAEGFSRSSLVTWFLLGGLLITLARMLLRGLMESLWKRGVGSRRCAIAGCNSLGVQVARNALSHPECGLNVIGFFDDRNRTRLVEEISDLPPFVGGIDDMLAMVQRGELDTVLVTLPMRAEDRIRHILTQCSDSTASVYIVPDFFVFELLHSRWSEVGGLPVVSVFETPLYGVDGWTKRAMDILLATFGVALISPVLIVIACLVKLTSKGPIFFRQKRYGLDGREIQVWKFRSMTTCENGNDVKQATKNDSRITPLGAILRKTSLDELPQLFNVIEGTMSLVGPRPHANAHNEHYRRLIPGYMLRHKVRPGITGLAQVHGCRGETETLEKMQRRVEYDHRYIREWSVFLDLKILIKTLTVVFKQENAY